MPSRAIMFFALALLLVASVAVCVRSYWRHAMWTWQGVEVAIESGAIYGFSAVDGVSYTNGRAGSNGKGEDTIVGIQNARIMSPL